MAKTPDFDVAKAHRWFAAYCFNTAWDLIERKNRTAADDRMMVALSQASIFHWSQRPDCEDRNMSIGYWQASHVQCLIGNPVEAARLGEICLSYSQGLPPFFPAHAHETLARAHIQMGQREEANRHLAAARTLLPLVQDQAERDRLVAELAELD